MVANQLQGATRCRAMDGFDRWSSHQDAQPGDLYMVISKSGNRPPVNLNLLLTCRRTSRLRHLSSPQLKSLISDWFADTDAPDFPRRCF